jgi:hypothetical protein
MPPEMTSETDHNKSSQLLQLEAERESSKQPSFLMPTFVEQNDNVAFGCIAFDQIKLVIELSRFGYFSRHSCASKNSIGE